MKRKIITISILAVLMFTLMSGAYFLGFWAMSLFDTNRNKNADVSTAVINVSDSVSSKSNVVTTENGPSETKKENVANNKEDILLVNKEHGLDKHYTPRDLANARVSSAKSIMLDRTAGTALKSMFESARKDGINLLAVSGYRSYAQQAEIYNRAVASNQPNVSKFYAEPGYSEHQTGLAADVVSEDFQKLHTDFQYTDAYKWMVGNSCKYGLIIRYPKSKTEITKYNFEPWHIRFVGKNVASEIYTKKITLEEYIDQQS